MRLQAAPYGDRIWSERSDALGRRFGCREDQHGPGCLWHGDFVVAEVARDQQSGMRVEEEVPGRVIRRCRFGGVAFDESGSRPPDGDERAVPVEHAGVVAVATFVPDEAGT